MSDEEWREIEREVKSGDLGAAKRYAAYLRRRGELIRNLPNIPPIPIEIQYSRIHGRLIIYPQSTTELLFQTPDYLSEEITTEQPLQINNVAYRFRGRYYFYEDLGWTPHTPETVAHARGHRSHDVAQEPVSYWLPRPEYSSGICVSCDKTGIKSQFDLRTVAYRRSIDHGVFPEVGRPASAAAIRALNAYLIGIIPQWIGDHTEIMRQAQLVYLQRIKKRLNQRLLELYQEKDNLEQQLGQAIIEELNLED